ncbi:hypothetical protein VPH35_036787 [Triticum aestivum]
MDRPSTSTNPLFLEQDDDMSSYVTKSHLFGAQRALHQEQQEMNERTTTSPPTCDSPSNVQETTSTTSSTTTNKRMTQEWTRFVHCCSTALFPLRPTQEGATRVDTLTTPSLAQVLRHRILFDVPRAETIKQTEILYTTMTLKSNFARKNNDTVKTKLLLHKYKNVSANANKKRKSERDNTKMHKMPRHNIKNNNSEKLKHLRRNMPFEIQVEP